MACLSQSVAFLFQPVDFSWGAAFPSSGEVTGIKAEGEKTAFPNLGKSSRIKSEGFDGIPFGSERGNTVRKGCGLTAEGVEVFRYVSARGAWKFYPRCG